MPKPILIQSSSSKHHLKFHKPNTSGTKLDRKIQTWHEIDNYAWFFSQKNKKNRYIAYIFSFVFTDT